MPVHSLSTSTNLVLQQKGNNSRHYTERRKKIENKKKAAITYNVQIVSWSQDCLLIVLWDDKEKKSKFPSQRSLSLCEPKHTQVRGTEVSLNDSSAIVLNYREGSSFLPFFLPPKFKCHSLCEVQSSKEDPPRQAGKKVKF